MSSVQNSSPGQVKRLPTWLSILIILLALTAGGWGVWRYFEGGPGQLPASAAAGLTDSNVDGPVIPREGGGRGRPPNFGQFAARIAANMPDGIMPAGNSYLVKAGTVRLDVDQFNGSVRGDWRYRFSYALPNLITPEQTEVLRTSRRVLSDTAAAEKAGVSADQIQQLQGGTTGPIGMVVDPPDRANISTLFRQWMAAAGRWPTTGPTTKLAATTRPISSAPPSPEAKAAEQKLLLALEDLGKRQLDPTRKAVATRVERVHTILGDTLLQKLKPAG